MSNIRISELRPLGSDLFQDSESFLNELTNDEVHGLIGGRARSGRIGKTAVVDVGTVFINTIFSANANTINANTASNANTLQTAVISQ
jgi:hypothetical protein